MQDNPAAAIDLPLRAVAWEENGSVWIAATDPLEIANKHHLKDRMPDALQMRQALDAALRDAVSPD